MICPEEGAVLAEKLTELVAVAKHVTPLVEDIVVPPTVKLVQSILPGEV